MFEQTFVLTGKTKRDRMIAAAVCLQGIGVLALAVLPLLTVEPISAEKRFTIVPPAMLKEAKTPEQRAAAQAPAMARARPLFVLSNLPQAHSTATHSATIIDTDVPQLQTGTGNGPTGVLIGGMDTIGTPIAIPAPRPTVKEPPKGPVRVSSSLSQAQLIFSPKPQYPRLAVQMRVEGTVRLQAVISREGRIENLHALSGHPLLIQPAIETVREWRYRPLLLNGEPVEIITEIDVIFSMKTNN